MFAVILGTEDKKYFKILGFFPSLIGKLMAEYQVSYIIDHISKIISG